MLFNSHLMDGTLQTERPDTNLSFINMEATNGTTGESAVAIEPQIMRSVDHTPSASIVMDQKESFDRS